MHFFLNLTKEQSFLNRPFRNGGIGSWNRMAGVYNVYYRLLNQLKLDVCETLRFHLLNI